VDINLVITPDFMSVLYSSIRNPDLGIVCCECIGEIVLKGMPKPDKLNLLQLLDINQIFSDLHHSQDEFFDESVAKLINNVGLELCICFQESKDDLDKQRSLQFLESIFPVLLEYLANEYDDTTTVLLPFLAAYLLIIKRMKRNNQEILSTENLLALTTVLIQRLKFDETETYNFGPDASEDEAMFLVLNYY
jgi:exportin-T